MKPGNIPLYVHKLSNHPPNVTKNIPAGVNKRLSRISSDETMFETAAPAYREALARSGYDFELKFDPKAAEPGKKSRSRKRNIIWFNPPYNSSVKTNIGAEFLKIVKTCFPQGHPLSKLINRNTVKISYSCMPNMERIISSRNTKILTDCPAQSKTCNCSKNTVCPLDGNCQVDNLVYQTTVEAENDTKEYYIGLASTTFKARWHTHKSSIKNEEVNQTSLSRHIRKLEKKNIKYKLSWKLVDRAKPFSPVSGVCGLCTKEKFYILFRPEMATINSRDEAYSNCRHKLPRLLVERKSRPKRPPA